MVLEGPRVFLLSNVDDGINIWLNISVVYIKCNQMEETYTLPTTAKAPQNRPFAPKGNESSEPTINFQGRC